MARADSTRSSAFTPHNRTDFRPLHALFRVVFVESITYGAATTAVPHVAAAATCGALPAKSMPTTSPSAFLATACASIFGHIHPERVLRVGKVGKDRIAWRLLAVRAA